MKKLVFILLFVFSFNCLASNKNIYVFANLDIEALDEKIIESGFGFESAGINQLVFIAPEPYVAGFKLEVFVDAQTDRLAVEFSQQSGYPGQIKFWKSIIMEHFINWDNG